MLLSERIPEKCGSVVAPRVCSKALVLTECSLLFRSREYTSTLSMMPYGAFFSFHCFIYATPYL